VPAPAHTFTINNVILFNSIEFSGYLSTCGLNICVYYKASTKTQNTKTIQLHKTEHEKKNKNNMVGKTYVKNYYGKIPNPEKTDIS